MAKTPKSRLKEMADQYSGLGAQLIVFDSTSSNGDVTVPNGHFHFTCQFTKGKNGRIFEGTGTGSAKKVAKHAACQRVLDLIEDEEFNNVSNVSDRLSGLRTSPMPPVVVIPELSPSSSMEMHRRQQLFNNGETFVMHSNTKPKSPKSNLLQNTTIAPDELQLDEEDVLKKATEGNRIGELQEFCVKNGLSPADYSDVTQWIGPDNSNRHKVACSIGDIKKYGVAKIKMSAKKIAAYKVLQALGVLTNSPSGTMPSTSTMIQIQPISPVRVQPPVEQSVSRPTKQVTQKIVYYPDAIIGTGATATVFEGYFEKPTRKAAVKICPKDIIYHEKNKELDIMRKLNDPNVVTYYTTEDIGHQTFIVMELASSTLEDAIKANKMIDPQMLKKWCADSTRGLAVLHSARIVHRDLKPSNVLIFNGYVAKLADFGISKELDSCTQGVLTEAARGTRIWMPPEGLKAIGSSEPFRLLPSFDIFSLGLTIFYTMTCGKHVFSYKDNEVPLQIQSNILEYRPNWGLLGENKWTSLKNLLAAMLYVAQGRRPDPDIVLEHPFFWDFKKGLDYVLAVNNDLKNSQKSADAPECKSEMVNMYTRFCNEAQITMNWRSRLCTEVQAFMVYKDQMREQKKGNALQIKKYNEASFLKLIEFIRDYYQHYEEWKLFEGDRLRQKDVFGPDGSNYGPYFLCRFPELTTVLYTFFQEGRYRELQLQEFYILNRKEYFPKW
ncbi:serine/threonine-protein kinase/endoribonuclease ire-1 isoform X1 [Folsomia candida]|uniref:serine/threonine-protein kinase/endoribonuclease ire-1 isoform X1 n=1 Tax=Folsomia candida TaxID=158441 RepID=UPI001604D0A0|nr:serine/threonine-protein kinase/endoribonuclease ire-1 isoform X1 [Folsomia candida]